MQTFSFELSAAQMQTIMLCLRGEYESVEGDADVLHDQLTNEGFSPFDNKIPAKLVFKDF